MFQLPRYVIKSGDVLVDDGEILQTPTGKTMYVSPEYDATLEQDISDWFEQFYTIRFRNYPVSADYLHEATEVSCRRV
jgi:formylmethanofuran dehydrogenase subunit A